MNARKLSRNALSFSLSALLCACSGTPRTTTAPASSSSVASAASADPAPSASRDFVECRMALRIQQDACRKDKDVPRKTDAEMAAFCKGPGHEPTGRVLVTAILANKDASCRAMGDAVGAAVEAYTKAH